MNQAIQNGDTPSSDEEAQHVEGPRECGEIKEEVERAASEKSSQSGKIAKGLAIVTIIGMELVNLQRLLVIPMINTYLINVWKLNLNQAAAIVNILEGTSKILPITLVFISDMLMGIYPVHLMTTIAYAIGVGLLAMSTPQVLPKNIGTCTNDDQECIGQAQRILFFTSLVLMALGISGSIFLKTELEIKNIKIHRNIPNEDMFTLLAVIIGGIGGTVFSGLIKPWSLRFGIPAIICTTATCFLVASFIAHRKRSHGKERNPKENLLINVVRVLVAAARKRSHQLPSNPVELYQTKYGCPPNDYYLPHTSELRWLDKAAIVLPDESIAEQAKKKWRLRTVTQVEEAKLFISTIPMFTCFIFCGLVKSIGNTYFLEQANNMSRKLGSIKIPILFLPMLYELFKLILEIPCNGGPKQNISSGLRNSVICCTIAAAVERRRLHSVGRHGLLDKPEQRVPMSLLWLIPQFFFLATVDSSFEKGVEHLFESAVPSSVRNDFIHFAHGVFGVGTLASVLSVYAIGKISERRGKNWFQYTLNRSRLDRYYWTLSALGAVNFVYVVVVFGGFY